MVPPRGPHAQREIARSNERNPTKRAVAALTCETQIAHTHRVVNVFENEPGVAGSRVDGHAQAPGTETLERIQQALIHFRFIPDVAPMSVRTMAVASLIFNKQAPPLSVGQLTGQNLVGERAHETGKLASENFHRATGRVVAIQRCCKTNRQRRQIRQK